MRTISDPSRASLRPDGVGSWPLTTLLVLMWLKSAATPAIDRSVLWPLLQFSPQLQSLEAAIGCFVATYRVHRGCRREQAERHEGSTSSTGTTAGQCHRQHRGRRPWRPTAQNSTLAHSSCSEGMLRPAVPKLPGSVGAGVTYLGGSGRESSSLEESGGAACGEHGECN